MDEDEDKHNVDNNALYLENYRLQGKDKGGKFVQVRWSRPSQSQAALDLSHQLVRSSRFI